MVQATAWAEEHRRELTAASLLGFTGALQLHKEMDDAPHRLLLHIVPQVCLTTVPTTFAGGVVLLTAVRGVPGFTPIRSNAELAAR